MDLDRLDELIPSDQWTFLLGRIAEGAVELDAALRQLHAQLRGLNTREAVLAAPQNWTRVAEQCRAMLACARVEDRDTHAAMSAAIDIATAAYDERNRFMHDLLTADVDDELLSDRQRIRQQGDRYLVRLTHKAGTEPVTPVTLDHAREVATTLVGAKWRLRAARGYLSGQTTWRTLLLGHLEGGWDGNATWTYSGPDADDLNEEDMLPIAPLSPAG